MNNQVEKIEDIFEISEVKKGDVNISVLRQGCVSITPNTDADDTE